MSRSPVVPSIDETYDGIVFFAAFAADAIAKGATRRTGGERIGNRGFFFQPTVLTDVPPQRAP